jgi:uncharacterized protein (TIGR03435 family)
MKWFGRKSANAGLAILVSFTASAQSVTAPLEFEVASVKVNKSGDPGGYGATSLRSGRINFINHRMDELIGWAWKIPIQRIDGPAWMASDRFDVVAKAPSNTRSDDARLMLRSLLAERFKLVVRRDEKVIPVFALVVGKRGPALTPTASTDEAHCLHGRALEGQTHVDCTNVTVTDLADVLPDLAPRYIDRPVVDLTGIEGLYDFGLDWTPQPESPDVPAGPTIFDDLDRKFGLKLEKQNRAMPTLIVNHIERLPTDN